MPQEAMGESRVSTPQAHPDSCHYPTLAQCLSRGIRHAVSNTPIPTPSLRKPQHNKLLQQLGWEGGRGEERKNLLPETGTGVLGTEPKDQLPQGGGAPHWAKGVVECVYSHCTLRCHPPSGLLPLFWLALTKSHKLPRAEPANAPAWERPGQEVPRLSGLGHHLEEAQPRGH